MGWSGGTYTKGNAGSGGWAGDASLGIGIEASRHDTQDNDFATGINTCLTKDGQNTPTANLGMGGYKHTGVGNATAGDEYLSYGQLLNANKAVTTSGTEPNYTVTLTPAPAAYFDGMTFIAKIHSTLTGTGATINVNGLGAKNIEVSSPGTGERDVYPSELSADSPYIFSYDTTDGVFKIISSTHSYETFTPTIASASGSVTLNDSTCTYSWFGNKILVTYNLNVGLTGSTSSWISATLPYPRAAALDEMPLTGWMNSISGATSRTMNAIMSTSSTVYFYRGDSLSNWPIDNMLLYATGVYQGSY